MSGWLGGRPQTSGLLALLCLGLSGLIYLQLEEPPLSREARSMPAGNGAGGAAQDGALEVDFEMPPLSVFAEITSRPLFSPSRRPAPPSETAAAEPEAPPADLDHFLLRGVAITGGERVALLERNGTGELVRVLEGQSLEGWAIAAIRPGEITLREGDREVVLEMEQDKSPPPARRRLVEQDERPGTLPLALQPELPADVPPEDEMVFEGETEADEVEFDPEAH